MFDSQALYILLLMIAAAVSAFAAYLAWGRRTMPGAYWVVVFLVAQSFWSLTYAAFWMSAPSARITWLNITVFGVVVVPVSFFAFTLHQTGRQAWFRKKWLWVFNGAFVLLTLVLLWTDPLHGLFYAGKQTAESSVIFDGGPWFWIHAIYSYGLLAVSTVWLAQAWRRSQSVFRSQAGLVLLAAILPWLTNAISLTGLNPLTGLDLTPISFTFSGLILTYSLARTGLLDLTPVARNQVVDTMVDSVIVVDSQKRIVDINPSAVALLASLNDDAHASPLGQPLARLLPASTDWSQDASVAEFAGLVSRPDGGKEACSFRVAISPLVGARGLRQGSVLVVSDITGPRRLEDARRQSLSYFRAIFESSTDAIFICDAETGVIIDANTRASEMFGYTRDEIIGSGDINQYSSGIEPYTRANGVTWFVRARDEGPQVFEWQGRTKQGQLIWLDMRIRHARLGESERFVMTVNDITERRNTQQRDFELALERERVHILEHFIRDASHEFRTPLATIQTSLYLLARSNDPQHRLAKTAQIEEEIRRLTRLLEMLVTLTTLDSGQPLNRQSVDVNALVRRVVSVYFEVDHAPRLELRLGEEVSLMADADLLLEALCQLVDNAVRFTQAGDLITVTVRQQQPDLIIEICDSGPGISPDALSHIFDRFFRLDTAHTSPGFGLGLAIAKRIFEAHGGSLTASSQLGEGSVFTATLPLGANRAAVDTGSSYLVM